MAIVVPWLIILSSWLPRIIRIKLDYDRSFFDFIKQYIEVSNRESVRDDNQNPNPEN